MKKMTTLLFTTALLTQFVGVTQSVLAASYANLFVMTAPSAQLKPIANTRHQYELTLKGMQPQVTYFTDKPERKTGKTTMAEFLNIWQANALNNRNNQPNVSLVTYARLNQAPLVYVFEIHNPHYDVHTGNMQFTALAIGDHKPTIQNHQLNQASLFIDDIQWNGNKFKPPH